MEGIETFSVEKELSKSIMTYWYYPRRFFTLAVFASWGSIEKVGCCSMTYSRCWHNLSVFSTCLMFYWSISNTESTSNLPKKFLLRSKIYTLVSVEIIFKELQSLVWPRLWWICVFTTCLCWWMNSGLRGQEKGDKDDIASGAEIGLGGRWSITQVHPRSRGFIGYRTFNTKIRSGCQ